MQEDFYFPALKARLPPEESEKLYRNLVAAKKVAPVTSHPLAPDKPLISKARAICSNSQLLCRSTKAELTSFKLAIIMIIATPPFRCS